MKTDVLGLPADTIKNRLEGFRDYEYDGRYLASADPTQQVALSDQSNYKHWIVYAPNFQNISPAHLFPTHGQFADWELGNVKYPASMFHRHLK